MDSTEQFTPETGDIDQIPADCYNILAHLMSEDNLLLITKPDPVVVGRLSRHMDIEPPMTASSKLISRKHFTIQYCNNEFSLTCSSKNGIYIDERFVPKSPNPYRLPKKCCIRFPSTNIKMLFSNLIGPKPYVGTLVQPHMLPTFILSLVFGEDAAKSNQNHAFNLSVIEKQLKPTLSDILPNEPVAEKPKEANESMGRDDIQQAASAMPLRDDIKPPFSYSQLIVEAIAASPMEQLTLSEIYTYLQDKYPYFRYRSGRGWQNSIRHNLSLNEYFVKVPRTCYSVGKGSLWRIDLAIYLKTIENRLQRRKELWTKFHLNGEGMSSSVPSSPDHSLASAVPIDDQLATSVPVHCTETTNPTLTT